MPTLSRRDLRPELMDDPALDPEEHRQALRALARIHRASGTVGLLWRELEPLVRQAQGRGRALEVLDVACGGGDLLLALERRARSAGLELRPAGVDLSSVALGHARAQARAQGSGARFERLDVLRDELPGGDVLLATYFLHHLEDDAARDLLARLARAARRAWIVLDLARGRAGHALAWVGTRLLTRSPIVRADGPRSVRNAFTAAEALVLARRAGLADARVRAIWPHRWILAGGGGEGGPARLAGPDPVSTGGREP